MTDDQQTHDDKTGKGKSTLVKVDPNMTNEQYIVEAEKHYIIPKLVREVFPDLVKLIFETESMDMDEREYWLQILPIMTEDQITKFRDILVNEKEQLDKLDTEYESEMSSLEEKHEKALDEEDLRRKREELEAKEKTAEQAEAQTEKDLLDQLDQI
jgi:hypothetical protein